jgi:branched-chain amino acid transport system substrate-binding protein
MAAAADDVIVIGGVGPLSQPGDIAGGAELKWAMEQAVADINAKGGVLGRKLKLEFEDTQNKPDVCAAMAGRLVEDKVVAVVGEFHSGCALAQIPTYNKAGMPAVFAETYNDKITGGDPNDPNLPANPPTIFRIAPTSTAYSSFMGDWMVNGLKAKKVGIVTEAIDYGAGEIAALKSVLDPAGVQLAAVTVDLSQPDYSAVISRMAADHPDLDVVDFDVSFPQYAVIENGIDSGLVTKNGVCVGSPEMRDARGFWQLVPNGVGCVFQLVGLTTAQFNDAAKSLNERAIKDLGHEARAYAYEAYDCVLLVADAIERAKSTDHAAIVTALETTSLVGTQGKYAFPYNSKNPVPAGKPSWLWHQYIDAPMQLMEYTAKGQGVEQAATLWPHGKQTKPGVVYISVTR